MDYDDDDDSHNHDWFHSDDDFYVVNPASGLPMIGSFDWGYDIGGNLYGFNDAHTRIGVR